MDVISLLGSIILFIILVGLAGGIIFCIWYVATVDEK